MVLEMWRLFGIKLDQIGGTPYYIGLIQVMELAPVLLIAFELCFYLLGKVLSWAWNLDHYVAFVASVLGIAVLVVAD
jgi:hypothetical protein